MAGHELVPSGLYLEEQRLDRMLAGLMSENVDVLVLLALMKIQTSRLAVHVGPIGAFLPPTEKNCPRWNSSPPRLLRELSDRGVHGSSGYLCGRIRADGPQKTC